MNEQKLTLIPYPRQLVRQTGRFAFDGNTEILLDPDSAQDLLGSAVCLQDALEQETGTAAPLAVATGPPIGGVLGRPA